jgi:hypothetical protein
MKITKQAAQIVKVLLINVLLLFILLELGSVTFYYWKTREFFYTRNRSQDRYASSLVPVNVVNVLDESWVYRLHPYLGYTYKPGFCPSKPGFRPSPSAIPANNVGFISNYDYPFQRKSDKQFIVGFFGGSVAQFLAMYEFERHSLADNLRKLPALKDKEIIVLNFALAGYKQPQQALVLSYFLSIGQDLDLIINLDGFNEVYHAALNNKHSVDVSMPASSFALPLVDIENDDLSPEGANVALSILQEKNRLKSLLTEATGCNLASSYLLKAMQIKHYAAAFERHRVEFNRVVSEGSKQRKQDPVIRVSRVDSPLEDEALYRKASAIWVNGSIIMRDMLAQRQIPYFHFIQPNQFYSSKSFSEQERKIALSKGGEAEYAESIRKGYPILSCFPESRI